MKRIYVVFLFLIIAAMIFTGCAAQNNETRANDGQNASYDYGSGETVEKAAAPEAPAAEAEEGIADAAMPGSGNGTSLDPTSILQPGVNRKIVYRGNIEANTKEFLKDCEMIENRLKELGGYIENSEISGKEPKDWQDEGRYAYMTLRVPSKHFDSFITMLKGVGQNIRSKVYGEDISLQYFDLETKLSTLRNRQGRLEEMLKDPAYKLEAIIELEKELADVSYEIQMLETNLRTYDSLVDFSTITITLYEVVEFKDITTPEEEDLGTRISNGFFSVLNAVADFGEGVIIFFAAGSPVLIPLAVIAAAIIILVKRSKKRRAKALESARGGQNNE